MLNVGVRRLNEQNTLSEVQHNRIVNDLQHCPIDCLHSGHRVRRDLLVAANLREVALTDAEDAVVLVLLDLVEHNVGVAAQALVGLSEDAVFVVVAEGVHEDVGLGAGDVNAALALFDFATLDLGVVAFGYFEARS